MLYDIDLYRDKTEGMLEEHEVKGNGKKRRKVIRHCKQSCLFKAPLKLLMDFGTQLGHEDVLSNLLDKKTCEQCGIDCSDISAEGPTSGMQCQGVFPICVAQLDPVDAVWD